MRARLALLAGVAAVVVAAAALGATSALACEVRPAPGDIPAVRYDPRTVAAQVVRLDLVVDLDSDCPDTDGPVAFGLVQPDGQTGRAQGWTGSIDFTLVEPGGADLLSAGSSPSPGQPLPLDLARRDLPGTSGSVSLTDAYRLVVAPGQWVAPGDYVQDVWLVAASDGDRIQSAHPMEVRIEVPPVVEIFVGGTLAGPTTGLIALGSLAADAPTRGSIAVTTRANGPYRLTLSRDNGHRGLRRGGPTSGEGADRDYVLYETALGGTPLGHDDSVSRAATSASGETQMLDVTVPAGATEGRLAGDYSDVITLTISAGA